MRRGRIFIYLALIIILGLAAVFLWFRRSSQQPATSGTEADLLISTQVVEEIEVVVITQNTPRGTLLDETILTTITLPKNDAVDGIFFKDLASVVGRRAKFDLDSGVPLTASMLVDSAEALSSTGSLAALLIPRGKVAVSVPINRLSSVSYAPMAGDHVSVIVTMLFVDIDSEFQTKTPNKVSGAFISSAGGENSGPTSITVSLVGSDALLGRTELDPLLNELIYVSPAETQRTRLVSQTLLPDVIVLQVGDFDYASAAVVPDVALAAGPEAPAVEPSPEPLPETPVDEGPKPPDVITLIVSPQDAVTLNYLLFSGAELTLALRGAGDDSIEATESATLQYLIDEYNIDVPAKLPYDLEPRVDELLQPVLENDAVANPTGE